MHTSSRDEHKSIVMLGIDPASKIKGGISSVVDVYRESGLFNRWRIAYIGTVASGSHAYKLRCFAAALRTYLKLLLADRISLVHAHTASRASFWRKSVFMLIARAAGIPVILHLHGGDFELFYRSECGSWRQRYIRYVLRSVNRVIVLSQQWRARIEAIEPAAQTVTIGNPVATASIVPAIAERQPADILYLGRFSERKGVFDLLKACAIVRSKHPAIRIRCGGEGEVAGVEALARELGLAESLHMLGWVSGAAKDRELMQATIYVLPSYAEGLPMGVLEAMAAGTPTVATSVGGIPDLIENGVSGFLIEPGDIDALADRIDLLLADADLRERFAGAARAKVASDYSTQRVLAQIEALYKRLGVMPRPVRITHPHSTPDTRERLDLSVGDR
jgi:glycosyltransferase involved in cell wall biosynthesis